MATTQTPQPTPAGHPLADPDGWAQFHVDLHELAGTDDVFLRRRAVLLRLLAQGVPPAALDAVLPGWSSYLGPR